MLEKKWCVYSDKNGPQGFGKIEDIKSDFTLILYSEPNFRMRCYGEIKIFSTLEESVQHYINQIPKDLRKKDGLEFSAWAIAKRRFPSELHNLATH